MPFTVPNEIVPAETEQDTIFGMEASQFRFVFTIFVAVFLSPLFSQVKTTQARHLFSLVPGLVMNFFIYGLDGIHPIIMTGYCYLIMRYVRSVYMPHIFFVISMAHLTYGQIYRYKYLYLIYTFDWTASTMLIAFRLAGAAWAVRDGRVILQEQQQQQQQMASAKAVEEGVSGDPTASRRVNKKDPYSLLTAQQKELAVMRDMTLLEVFGLSFFFPGFTAGPYPEAKRYIEFCERTGMFAAAPSPFKMSNRGIRQKVGEFVVSALVFVTVSDTLSEDTLREESFVQKTNVFERILFMIVSVNVGSCKYYIVWSLGELGHILSGISYDGVDASGREKWDGCLQMDLKKFYTFKTCREVTSSWNKCAQNYLKINIYQRARPFVNRNLAQLLTFVLSAFWHGIYPGYFIFFLSAVFFTVLLEYTNYKILPHFFTPDGKPHSDAHKRAYSTICWFCAQYALTYIILSFRAFSVGRTLIAWKSVGFSGHVVVFGYFGLGLLLPRVPESYKQGFPYIPKYVLDRKDRNARQESAFDTASVVQPIAPIDVVVTEK